VSVVVYFQHKATIECTFENAHSIIAKRKCMRTPIKRKEKFSKFSDLVYLQYVYIHKAVYFFTFDDVYGDCARSVVSPSCLSHERARDERKRARGRGQRVSRGSGREEEGERKRAEGDGEGARDVGGGKGEG